MQANEDRHADSMIEHEMSEMILEEQKEKLEMIIKEQKQKIDELEGELQEACNAKLIFENAIDEIYDMAKRARLA